MDINHLSSIASRILFAVAFALSGLGIVERAVNAFGYTVLRGALSGGRLLEIAAIVLIFVIALLLQQIREQLRSGGTAGT
jgi:hypothetical protein